MPARGSEDCRPPAEETSSPNDTPTRIAALRAWSERMILSTNYDLRLRRLYLRMIALVKFAPKGNGDASFFNDASECVLLNTDVCRCEDLHPGQGQKIQNIHPKSYNLGAR